MLVLKKLYSTRYAMVIIQYALAITSMMQEVKLLHKFRTLNFKQRQYSGAGTVVVVIKPIKQMPALP